MLDRTGVVAEERLRETLSLSWPRIVTGFAIMSKRTVDLAVVGVAVGAEAVAGLTLANAFWTLGKFAFIGFAGGTIALVSQHFGGDDRERAGEVVAASLVLAAGAAVPVAVAYNVFATPLVTLVGGGQAATGFGATYLAIVAPGIVFEAVNLVASRTYAGVGDTVTPMAVRAAGAVLNVLASVGLVFGLDLGVVGAAIGTTVSTGIVTGVFAWGLGGRSYYRGRGASPLPVGRTTRPDGALVRELFRVATPLVARRVVQGVFVFPLLALAATFGPVVLAAVGVARQVRQLLNSFSWGFSIAASTLVGQALGAGEETRAVAYGRDITTLSAVVYALSAAVVGLLATPVASVFVDGEAVAATAVFVAVAALSALPLGVDGSVTGTLRGAGDTRVPFLATLAGLYLVALPLAYLGTETALGVVGLYLAVLAETLVPMVVNVARFRTGAWLAVGRELGPDAEPDPGEPDPTD
ncbi:MATE family efflux transporter [Halobaculum sp. MBLA0147]|uniref:MATE family efflux transporter n=1 Tax=Halobaculum sp. MBLA0147 TaxID=3079934 RepID=UPI0035266738